VAGVETPHKPLPVQVPGKQLLPKWVDGNVIAAASMGSEKTTAQVGVREGGWSHTLTGLGLDEVMAWQ
jgi:hypothetical protein